MFQMIEDRCRLTLVFLGFAYFTSSLSQILLIDIFPVVSDGEHPSLSDDITQISTVECIRQL